MDALRAIAAALALLVGGAYGAAVAQEAAARAYVTPTRVIYPRETLRAEMLEARMADALPGGVALSFDEVIVTTFTAGQQQTLPIWMFSELIRPRQRPVTNVVAVMVIAVTLIPILAAYYLTRHGSETAGAGK